MRKKTAPIRVFLVDDHPALREGVRAYLDAQAGISVVGEAAGDAEALRKLKKTPADVVVLDISLKGLDGGELARRLRSAAPGVRLVAFSIHSSQEYVVRMARCGVQGYVMKDAPTSKLLEAVRRVHAGGLAFPHGMAAALLAPGAPLAGAPKAALTAREREVLVLLADGLANKEVARKLGISVRTAETHREHLSRKLGIAPIAGLTKYAIQEGLTPLRGPAPDEPEPRP
jgi:two-component system nitrate/nitrite response regulator NarL